MATASDLATAAVTNTAIAAVVVGAFCFLRPRFKSVYQPRFDPRFRHPQQIAPPAMDDGLFSWISPTLFTSEKDMLLTSGLDAVMYIRFFVLCIKIFGVMSFVACVTLIPINYAAIPDSDLTFTDLDQLSMTHVGNGSHALWAHLIFAYIFYAVSFYFIAVEWRYYIDYRLSYLTNEHLQNRRLTIIINNLPADTRTDKTLLEAFRGFFPHAIVRAYMARDLGKLPKHIAKRKAAQKSLEHALVQLEKNPDKPRPQAATKCFCCGKVDAIEYHSAKMVKYNELVEAEQSADPRYLLSGFVTFNSVIAYQSAIRLDKDDTPFSFLSYPAPEPTDIYWPSMNIEFKERIVRQALMTVFFWALVLFWMIPVAAVQSISNLQTLTSVSFLHWLAPINDWPPVLVGIISGFLPGLALLIFNIILPMILYAMSQVEGIQAQSWLQMSVLNKFFVFQLINNFLGTVIVGTFLNDPSTFVNDPANIVNLLSTKIPANSTFFINYILFTTLSFHSLQLLNVATLIIQSLFRYLALTQRELYDAEAPQIQDYGLKYPLQLFVFIIAAAFMVIAPLVLPFVVIFYCFAYVANRYQLLYVYCNPFQTGGTHWPNVFRKMMIAIILGQVLLIGLFALKQVAAITILTVPILCGSLAFWYGIEEAYSSKTEMLPLTLAVDVDSEIDRRMKIRAAANKRTDENGEEIKETEVVTAAGTSTAPPSPTSRTPIASLPSISKLRFGVSSDALVDNAPLPHPVEYIQTELTEPLLLPIPTTAAGFAKEQAAPSITKAGDNDIEAQKH